MRRKLTPTPARPAPYAGVLRLLQSSQPLLHASSPSLELSRAGHLGPTAAGSPVKPEPPAEFPVPDAAMDQGERQESTRTATDRQCLRREQGLRPGACWRCDLFPFKEGCAPRGPRPLG